MKKELHYPTADSYLIKTPTQALYYAADIPPAAWGPLLTEDPEFKLAVFDGEGGNVSPQVQREWFSRMRSGELFSLPYLILMVGDESEDVALLHGFDMMKRALGASMRVNISDSSSWTEERREKAKGRTEGLVQAHTEEETVHMLYNVSDEGTKDRVQIVRDWIFRHKSYFRLVCAAGDPAAIRRKLKVDFNAVFYLSSRTRVELNFS